MTRKTKADLQSKIKSLELDQELKRDQLIVSNQKVEALKERVSSLKATVDGVASALHRAEGYINRVKEKETLPERRSSVLQRDFAAEVQTYHDRGEDKPKAWYE